MTTTEHNERRSCKTFVILGAPFRLRPPKFPPHFVIPDGALHTRHPGRGSEPGSSCSVECLASGKYSTRGGLLDTGSEPAPAYEPGTGMTRNTFSPDTKNPAAAGFSTFPSEG
ncbi:hypothetical protein IMCC21906_00128 [Spongiibacter sp. IMCC21906]|nr:hypothetical protein IMCC21906_00128 [Spongiibacter sp. IMCC21906]